MTRPALICASHTISGALPGMPARHGFADRVQAAADAGYDGMVIHFRDHLRLVSEGADAGAMRAAVTAAGLRVPEVEFLSVWHGPDRNEAGISAAIATAGHFGAERLNVGADTAGLGLHPKDIAEDFRRLCGLAADAGVEISLEVIAWGGLATLDAAQELLAASGGNAGLLIDVWHVIRAPGIGLDHLADLDPALVNGLQINDAGPRQHDSLAVDTCHRLLPGQGTFDLPRFLNLMALPAQRCGLSIEVISPFVAAMNLAQAARQSHDLTTVVLAALEQLPT